MRHFRNISELSVDELSHLLALAHQLKSDLKHGVRKPLLAGRVLGMIFEKPSLRTRVSFETAMAHLGGTTIFLPSQETGLGSRESVPDFARTISQYVDAVVLRVFKQECVETFAKFATCPIINGLSDYYHPCQALGDLLTLQELFGDIRGKTLVFVGDGNNVARSLALGCGYLGVRFILASPPGYGFDAPFVEMYRRACARGEMLQNGDPRHAVSSADVIYTDVWTSMGQEAEREQRKRSFKDFQVDSALLKLAPAHCKLMHCLPANRGEEVTSEVLDSDRSVVFQQAGNRMHAQKALLQWLLT
jgi:ornithine carbamoyltransferase